MRPPPVQSTRQQLMASHMAQVKTASTLNTIPHHDLRLPSTLLALRALVCVVLPARFSRGDCAVAIASQNPADAQVLETRLLHGVFQAGVPACDSRG